MVCHWTGIYFNGEEVGFKIFQEVVRRLHARYDNLVWMKNSEIARYWAAKELTHIASQDGTLEFAAPFGCPRFTFEWQHRFTEPPTYIAGNQRARLRAVQSALALESGTYFEHDGRTICCLDLAKGTSQLT